MVLKIEFLDLEKHWSGINTLLRKEDWPFILDDFKVSHIQEKSLGLVVVDNDVVVGFFTLHNFSTIAYHDLFIIEKEYRKDITSFLKIMMEIKKHLKFNGLTTEVAHCTKDSSAFVKFLGFKPRAEYLLLRKLASGKENLKNNSGVVELSNKNKLEIIELDKQTFGIDRKKWISDLLDMQSTKFYGLFNNDKLDTFLVLRKRYGNSYTFDTLSGCNTLRKLELVSHVIDNLNVDFDIDTFVLKGSILEKHLILNGFSQPEFFKDIGPLVEYVKGNVSSLNVNSMETMSWI